MNSTPVGGMNRNMSSSQLSSMGPVSGTNSQPQSSGSGVGQTVANSLSSSARGPGAGSPLLNPLMAMANNLSNPLAAATNLLTASAASGNVPPNPNQLLAQLCSFLKP